MMYPPGMQGYPTMNPNFSAAQFFPQGRFKIECIKWFCLLRLRIPVMKCLSISYVE